MATNLRNRLQTYGSSLSNLDGGTPIITNNGAVVNGLTPINDTFNKGTYLNTLLASGTFDPLRALDPTNPDPRVGGI